MNTHHRVLLTLTLEVAAMCAVVNASSLLFRSELRSRYRDTPFESGMKPIGEPILHLGRRIHTLAAMFLIFDVEMLYVYVWSVNLREAGWGGVLIMTSFILYLIIALLRMKRSDVLARY